MPKIPKEIKTIETGTPADPSEPPVLAPTAVLKEPDVLGLPPLSPARQWLFDHKDTALNMQPYVDGMVFHVGDLEQMYPAVAPKIIQSRKAGYSDTQIMSNIADRVERSLNAGYTDAMIEQNLFRGYKEYGFWDRPIGSFFYGRPKNVLEKAWDYLGTTPDYRTDPIKHELRAVVERGLSSFTLGLSDAAQWEAAYPETLPGTLAGSVASLIGFISGPLKLSKYIIGGRLAPTATGLRGVAQIMTEGGATLGLAGGLSRIVPALQESESLTEAGLDILENTATLGLIGALYPLAGVIPTKPLRLAVGLAALDLIRGKGEFTIDDVVKGVADGTIDRDELAERSFGYLLNLYFLNKVKPMRQQLAGLEKNAMIRKMLECNPDETESVIIQLRKANLIPRDPERFLTGLRKWDKVTAFGSEKNFNKTYKLLMSEQANLAKKIQADIEGKATVRIPKSLNALAQAARQFRKPSNFANTIKAKAKLSETEKVALDKILPTRVRVEKPAAIEKFAIQQLQKTRSLKGITDREALDIIRAKGMDAQEKAVKQILHNRGIDVKKIDVEQYEIRGRTFGDEKFRPTIKGKKPSHQEAINFAVNEAMTDVTDVMDVQVPYFQAKPTIAKPKVKKPDFQTEQLNRFWQAVQQRDYLEKQSQIQHKSQAEKILDAAATEKMYNQSDIELQRLNQGGIRKVYQGVARAVWDTSANIKKDLLKKGGALGKEAIIRHDLIRGAGPKSARILQTAGDKIYTGLNKSEQTILNRIIQSRRTIAIEKYRADIKHPAGLGLKEHQAYLDSVPKDLFMMLNKRADLYFGEMKSQLSQLHKAGIISKESYSGLLQKGDYSPRHFIQYIDPERTYTFAGKKITVRDSGIQALDEGSYKTLENDSRGLLAQVVTRTQARIFRNEANRALYELARQIPDNSVVQLSKVIKMTKKGEPVYQKPPAGFEEISVMVDGQVRPMLMPSGTASEWVTMDPAVSSQFANIAGWLSGAKILRPMATGINPEFAITNLPRDIAHAWITTHEYSPHIPIAAAQMIRTYGKTAPEAAGFHPIRGAKALLTGKDYKTVWQDTFNRNGAWFDYINEGGGMSFLTHQGGGGTYRAKAGRLSTLRDVLGYLGETSEIWTRLALRNQALRNGKPPHEATWIARNYIDFSQGGSVAKGADTGVPYLNAGIQGTRGIFRAAQEKPATFVYKMAEIGTLATGLYLANKNSNPECWDSVSDHDKANYFIITTPLTYQDEENNTRHLYFRVAKDQGQKLTCTLFENLMAKYLGEDIDVDQITKAAQEFITITPNGVIPPALDAMLGYLTNVDFWRNEDIWKRGDIEPAQEYTQFTHPAFAKVGELTGLSPERTRYALQQYFTYGNIYTSAVGGGLRLIMDKLPEDVREQTTEDMLRQAPFLRRVLRATDPFTQYAKDVKDARLDDATRKYVQTRTLDSLSEVYYTDKADDTEIRQFIAEQPWQDRQRLVERHKSYGRLTGIPDKRWWLNLIGLPPEPRATVFWTRWQQADEAERTRLDEYMRQVPTIISERFMIKLSQLKQQKK